MAALHHKFIHTSRIIILHERALSSAVCHITRRSSKGKSLEVPCKYNYYCGPTKDPVLIQNPEFIFLFPQRLNETGHNSRQYGSYVANLDTNLLVTLNSDCNTSDF